MSSKNLERTNKSGVIFVLNIVLLIESLVALALLLWLRIDWGFTEWINESAFYNFWNGTYVMMSGTILMILNTSLGLMCNSKRSVPGLAVHAVMHGTSAVLLCLGSIAMLSDAFGTREDWLHGMILDLMNPTNSNHYIYKDTFLGNMYRIVRCCGADGPDDYSFLYDMSPPAECTNHWALGGRDFERGCAKAFSVWLKAWAGGISGGLIIGAIIEIFLIVYVLKQIKYLKFMIENDKQPMAPNKELPPIPPHRELYDMESEAFLPQKREFFQPNPPQRSTSVTHLSQPAPGLPPLHRTPSVRFGEVKQRQFQRSMESIDQLQPQIGLPMQPNPRMRTSNVWNPNTQEPLVPALPKREPKRNNIIASPPPIHQRYPEPTRFSDATNQKKSILKSNTNSSTDESTRRDDTIRLFGKGTGQPLQDAFERDRSSTMTSETMERFGGFDSDYQQRIFLNKPSEYEEITSPSLNSPMTNRRKKMPIPNKERSRSKESLAKLSAASSTSSSASEAYYIEEARSHKRSRSPETTKTRRRSHGSIFPPPVSPHLNRRRKGDETLQRSDQPRRSSSRGGIFDMFGSSHSLRRSRSGHLNRNEFDDPPRRSNQVGISDFFRPSHSLRRSRSGHLNRNDFDDPPIQRQRSGSSHSLFWGSRSNLQRSNSGPLDDPNKYRDEPQKSNHHGLPQKTNGSQRNDVGLSSTRPKSKASFGMRPSDAKHFQPEATVDSTERRSSHNDPIPPILPPRPKNLASKGQMTTELKLRGQIKVTPEIMNSHDESTIVIEERSTQFPGFVRHKRKKSGSNLIETSI